ncbi:MAG TPA: GWxTD domain-containing protein, partial [Longimicrobiales bacterium]|nr:GWxTD domain-containing protein [Longimicrobiales bacterium]
MAGALVLAGCGGAEGRRGGPSPMERGGLAHPLEIYSELGLLTGSERFPAVASFVTLAGPADSTWVVLGLSLPASALRFQREAEGFRAEYTITVEFLRDSVSVERLERHETVRVPTFADTERTEESVVFQSAVALPPGEYVVELDARDAQSSRGFQARDPLEVPAYGETARRVAGPFTVYRASGRADRSEVPDFILNPRQSVEYGGQAPRLYLESYGLPEGTPIRLMLSDADGAEAWVEEHSLDLGHDALRYLIADVPSARLTLGRMEVAVELAAQSAAVLPLLVIVSDQWVVANFEEVLQFVSYIASEAEMDTLRGVHGGERQAAWERFWERRDPLPATPINEFRESFFERVRLASQRFREPGTPGWRSDRGEVYIVLGPPSGAQELAQDQRDIGVRAGGAVQWIYDSAPGGRLTLVFVDQTGFGRYELTPSSRSAFRSAAERLRPRGSGRSSGFASRRSARPGGRAPVAARRTLPPGPRVAGSTPVPLPTTVARSRPSVRYTVLLLALLALPGALERGPDVPAAIEPGPGHLDPPGLAAAPRGSAPAPVPEDAVRALEQGRYWRASRILSDHLASAPDTVASTLLLLARAHAGWGDWGEAERLLAGRSWLDQHAEARGRALLGDARLELGRWDEAARDLARYLEAAPATGSRERGLVELRRARALREAGAAAASLEAYARALGHLPQLEDWIRLSAAEVAAEAGDTAGVA